MQTHQIGHIARLTRYPFKSMAGIDVREIAVGWHGLAGDRRFAARLTNQRTGFPWLSASRLPELLLYHPCDFDTDAEERLPRRVQTPSGVALDVNGDRLAAELSGAVGSDVEVISLKHGMFDDAPVSMIASETVSAVCRQAEVNVDVRRFRANVVIDCGGASPFTEDGWVDHVMSFGTAGGSPAIHVTKRDVRCQMINLDPDTAGKSPSVLQSVVSSNDNTAGVYGVVVRTGTIRTGDPVFLAAGG